MKIAYVVLNYLAYDDTVECVESILNNTKKSKHEVLVILIDNGSPNGVVSKFRQLYQGNDKVHIIYSNKNIGFARGNNLGFEYAKKVWHADFIVQLNNDTVIFQDNFNEIIVKKYFEYKYAVLGPDIETNDGFHQNPVPKKLYGKLQLLKYRIKKYVKIIILKLGMKKLIHEKNVYSTTLIRGDIKECFLHGACYIFSPIYIEMFDGLDPRTFLYWEEDILMLKLKMIGLSVLYSSDLSIRHKEDVSTKLAYGEKNKKAIWMEKQLISSSRVYEKIYKEYS